MSKLGPHVIHTTDAARRWATVAPIVKGLDNVGILQSAPESSVRVFRHYFPDPQPLDDAIGTARAILSYLGGYKHPNLYVEVWNEAHPKAAQLRAVVDILHGHGLKVCGPCWATGNYEEHEWNAFRAEAWCGLDAIAVHAYSSIEVGPTEWNAFRWRKYYDPALDRNLPVFVTEFGLGPVRDGDPKVNDGMIGADGWKLAKVTPERYAAFLLEYDQQLRPNEHATVFTCGASPDWDRYNADEVVPLILAGMPAPQETHVPTIGTGLQKAESFLGPFLEDETYDQAGTPSEVSKAANAQGWATWTKATNETVVYKITGEMWRDYGNHGDGSLKVLAPPFK